MEEKKKQFEHTSVLLTESVEALRIREKGIYVDGTLGGGGHSEAILKQLQGGKLIGIDRDADAISAATKRLSPYGNSVTIVNSNYEQMNMIINKLGYKEVDGILLDLGVSSYQLDEGSRGFSYMQEDARLDMRMDQSSKLDAATVVNTYSGDELTKIFRDYGEERFARRIAERIIAKRQDAPIETAGTLNRIIDEAIPMKYKRSGGHPSKRVYQALRIEVNDELGTLKGCIDGMIDLLSAGGRLCVITFHSLEDRIVKQAFRRNEDPCTCPKNLPVCVCGKQSKGRVITRKPTLPSEAEMKRNSRARSAKLRVFERRGQR
ncbi:MAG: 16S rRNA (cytosine(1402)-N(4))-methyltransferase RsmH [Lachnospiraceae bacterium]|nr:16S rRNA (cytosine(1402)-N(4))-methyltransferase RsmH [Lachnospiraceae bacterium]